MKRVWLLHRVFRIDDMERVDSLGVFKSSEDAMQYVDRVEKITNKMVCRR